MAYWVDDNFDTWPEVFRAGTAAIGLYSRCGAYCARNSTDGLIPLEVAASYGTREWITKLVEVGLWEIKESGYRDVYYLVAPDGSKLNPTKAEVVKKREQAKARQQKHRKGNPNPVTRDSRVTNTSRDALPTLPPSLPPSKEGKGGKEVEGGEDLKPVDWRRQPAFGAPRDPNEAARTAQRAAELRATLPSRKRSVSEPPPFERLVALVPDPPPEQEQAA